MRFSRPLINAALLAPAALILVAALPVQASEMDTRIENTIKNSYNFKTYLSVDPISVSASKGVVTLSGTVSEDYHRVLAAETVADTAGVKSVNNEIKLKNDVPSENSDAWVTMKVKGALAFHKNVSATGTEVFTNGGAVTLKGEAHSAAQRELTSEYAKDVVGVKSVSNLMTVGGVVPAQTLGEKVDDASITAQIKTSLLFHQSTHVLATKVKTKDGVVILNGEAANASEKALVGKLAEDTTGVKSVENHMTVKS